MNGFNWQSTGRFVLNITPSFTALVEFTDNPVEETREISENIYIDLDASGNPVSMTIEHASKTAHLPDITYQQIEKERA